MSLPYRIRRSQRAKKARIVVTHSKIEVVAPPRMKESIIHGFVQDKQGWIVRAMEKLKQRERAVSSYAPEKYVQGAEIPFRGDKFPLTIAPTKLKKIKIEFDQEFLAQVPVTMLESDKAMAIREAIIRWMKKHALKEVEIYVHQYAQRMQLFPRSIRIKNQRSRWGSCGIKNDINLNWLLILAPPEVFEYVVVHELCHIQVRNHSNDFWSLVAEFFPDYKKQKCWLKTNGGRLMLGL